MSYYFPGILTSRKLQSIENGRLKFTLNNAANAISLVLSSYNLDLSDNVALPLFVCDSVKEAVLKSGLNPIYFDLKDYETYWTDYKFNKLTDNKIRVLILVHLYGFLHPDTKDIIEFCQKNNIKIIHDVAQSYGINPGSLKEGTVIYSFGPGKSTVAAEGGLIENMDSNYYYKNVSQITKFSLRNIFTNLKANLFISTRQYQANIGYLENIYKKLVIKINSMLVGGDYVSMTQFQIKAAMTIITQLKKITKKRKVRYEIIQNALQCHPKLMIPKTFGEGLFFKMVIFNLDDNKILMDYLSENKVPYFRLVNEESIALLNQEDSDSFKKNAPCIFEFSTEISIPIKEIERVANILRNFK